MGTPLPWEVMHSQILRGYIVYILYKAMKFPEDQAWKYNSFLILAVAKAVAKCNKRPGPKDHERRPMEEKLVDIYSWL